MYFPYLRGKQFELQALLNVPVGVYANTIPIVEPIKASGSRIYTALYSRLAAQQIPFILITNPHYPTNARLTSNQTQAIITGELAAHNSLTLSFIIDQRFNIAFLNAFLGGNPNYNKALIFRFSPNPADIAAIQAAILAHPVQYIIFDDRRTNNTTRVAFIAHPNRVLITDGFQRQDRNVDYPASSMFESSHATRVADGWFGVGDYLTIGDFFQAGGGQGYVVTLHVTAETPANLVVYHFSSTIHANTLGLTGPKFAQANGLLVASPNIIPLTSSGLTLYRGWHAAGHNPQLGAAKQASLMHHIELMSGLV